MFGFKIVRKKKLEKLESIRDKRLRISYIGVVTLDMSMGQLACWADLQGKEYFEYDVLIKDGIHSVGQL